MGSHTADYRSRKFITGHKMRQRLQFQLLKKRLSHMFRINMTPQDSKWKTYISTVYKATVPAGNKAEMPHSGYILEAERQYANKPEQMSMAATQEEG